MSFMKLTAEDIPDIPDDFDDVFSREDEEPELLNNINILPIFLSEGENNEHEPYPLDKVVEKVPGVSALFKVLSLFI